MRIDALTLSQIQSALTLKHVQIVYERKADDIDQIRTTQIPMEATRKIPFSSACGT